MLDTSLCAKKSPPESKQIPVNSGKKKSICHLQPQCNYSVEVRQNENNPEVPTTRESWAQAKSPSCARFHCVCLSTRLSIVKRPSERQTWGFFLNPAIVLQNIILQGAWATIRNSCPSWDFLREAFSSHFVEQISNYSISFGLQCHTDRSYPPCVLQPF